MTLTLDQQNALKSTIDDLFAQIKANAIHLVQICCFTQEQVDFVVDQLVARGIDRTVATGAARQLAVGAHALPSLPSQTTPTAPTDTRKRAILIGSVVALGTLAAGIAIGWTVRGRRRRRK